MDVDILQEDGGSTGRTASLDPQVFDIEPNDHVIWLDVKRIQAHRRQGTHKTKERSEVRGSGRKLYRQKGTGNARVGDAQSPIRRGGGRAHGVRPRDYKQNLNKKTKRLARRSALTYKAKEDGVRVIEDFSMETPSTRAIADLLDLMDLKDQKVLIVTTNTEKEIYISSRNLPKVSVQEARSLNTYEILDCETIVLQEGALEHLTDLLSPDKQNPEKQPA
jgi:large subunit ribosomal protein L4